ncbi:hypothetical protein BU26DRAFT_211588 [Trematosphaeria pertusa]|uniref:Kazal-like domain-containing protein n=1 Tax=Trematosphaeria pertusa TaxID=390896 RepID=A0A6A6IRY9_9PLEO|nr:uncharacterized protein BU26DRAFT_211588 [Trematosphaeria pertusa]KAF2252917.1 hypothetical protein BU26DRAFT_211588 [Trematosphaeria pertusa]
MRFSLATLIALFAAAYAAPAELANDQLQERSLVDRACCNYNKCVEVHVDHPCPAKHPKSCGGELSYKNCCKSKPC